MTSSAPIAWAARRSTAALAVLLIFVTYQVIEAGVGGRAAT
jgi:hypothetical protein